ncbi:MAG: hypothetical protein KBF62_00610 [Candidatus Pacebacteria bacterium]|nr:hypothetical protein [Candidatus Paceibacterota bacterium]MBP9058124.1 hypothetical protein [Candidatus Paceibacterota bacterium]MBP9770106.1 hypothetical protein [Candidatus Paceibacterota bacterium]
MELTKKYIEDFEYNRLEAFALVLQYRLRKMPFFDHRYNHLKLYRSGRELIFEVSMSRHCFLKYIFSFSKNGLDGKDWIMRKRGLDIFVSLSQRLGDFSDRLINVILYSEISHWLRGHNVERRVILLIENYINKEYKKDVYLGIQNKYKDYVLKYDLEIISRHNSFNPIFIDVKSSVSTKEKAENQIINGERGKKAKVHILHVDDSDSDDRVIFKFEEIKRSHLNGHLVSV